MLCPLSLVAIAPVSEAAPTLITLRWTAPGDDASIGKPTRYDLRYSTQRQTTVTFTNASVAPGLPLPKPAGSLETYTLAGLSPDSTYYIALKARDDAGNWSAISNVLAARPSATVGVPENPMVLAFAEPWPNPARSSVQLSYSLPQAGETQTRVFDVTGRSVRILERGWHAAGQVPMAWDLKDEHGDRVPTGVYFIFATALGRRWTRRVAVVQ